MQTNKTQNEVGKITKDIKDIEKLSNYVLNNDFTVHQKTKLNEQRM